MTNTPDSNDIISVSDMRHTLEDEIAAMARVSALRTTELTNLVTRYAAAEIDGPEATQQFLRYFNKWGDVIPGLPAPVSNYTDAQIHASFEEGLGSHATRATSKKGSSNEQNR